MSDASTESRHEPSSPGPAPELLNPAVSTGSPVGSPVPLADDPRVRPTPARGERESGRGQRERGNGRGRRNGRGNGANPGRGPQPNAPTANQASREEVPDSTPAPSAASRETPAFPFVHEGIEWIARLAGVSASGRARPGAGAPLMLITFARANEPDVVLFELLDVGRSLDALGSDQLAELMARARPLRPSKEPEDIFSDTRARKKGDH